MLTINNVEYKNIEKFIDFDPFEGIVEGKKRKGKVLYITLKTNDFKLCIETVYDKEWIKELKINDKKDISKFIAGLTYEEGKDFMILTGKCNCTINRINDYSFEFSLNGHFKDYGEEFKIEYDDIFEI